jgi:hypothetical protein
MLRTDWNALRDALVKWIEDNPGHLHYGDAVAFRDGGWDRRNFQLKNLRNVLVGLTPATKPWEVAVGQAIAGLRESRHNGEHSLAQYLGKKTVQVLGSVDN